MSYLRLVLLAAVVSCTPAADSAVVQQEEGTPIDSGPVRVASTEIPEGVQQLLPRGGIPAVFDPKYVPASSARISDDAWVLGVEIDGEARAYSLNLLNQHEIVNDTLAATPIAAVW